GEALRLKAPASPGPPLERRAYRAAFPASGADALPELADERSADLAGVGYNGHVRHLHHGGVGVLVHRDDEPRVLDAGRVLDRPTDAEGEEHPGADVPVGLADQGVIVSPL